MVQKSKTLVRIWGEKLFFHLVLFIIKYLSLTCYNAFCPEFYLA